CLFIGLTSCATVWAAVGRSSFPAAWLMIVATAATFIAMVACGLLGAPGGFLVILFFATGLSVLLTGGALLMLRAIGFRLVRPRRGEVRTTAEFLAVASDPPPNE